MTLCLLKRVLDSCSPPNWENNDRIRLTVEGSSVSFADLRVLAGYDVYTSHISDPARQSQFSSNLPGDLPPGVAFTLTLPRTIRKTVVARNLNDLISIDSATRQTPPAYFLVEEEETKAPFCFTGDVTAAPNKVKKYHQAIELWELVKDKAEHTTPTGSVLFFGVERMEILPAFALGDLASDIEVDAVKRFQSARIPPEILQTLRSGLDALTGDDVDELKQFLEKQSSDIRTDIFRSVLSEFLRDQRREDAFACLLRSSGKFVQRLNEAWKIYISTFSPEKLNEQALAKHLELTEKLEKIIGGMEVKGLTIPAAILLAVKEVQFGAHWTTLNTMILVASVVYVLAMIVAYFGQRSTLNLLTTTIDETKRDLRTQGLDENNKVLKNSFGNLESRTSIIGYVSMALVIFSSIPLIAVIYAVFCAAPPPPKPTEPAANNATASPAALR